MSEEVVLCDVCDDTNGEQRHEASVRCEQCNVRYCTECRSQFHPSKGALKLHTMLSVKSFLCDVCDEATRLPAVVVCQQCRLQYCNDCQASVHPQMGRLKSHILLPVNSSPPMVPPEDESMLLPPPIDEPLPDSLLAMFAAPPSMPDELPDTVKAALTAELNASPDPSALVRTPSFKAQSVFQRAPSRPPPMLSRSAKQPLSESDSAIATSSSNTASSAGSSPLSASAQLPTTTATADVAVVTDAAPPAVPTSDVPISSVISPRASSVISPRPAPPKSAPPQKVSSQPSLTAPALPTTSAPANASAVALPESAIVASEEPAATPSPAPKLDSPKSDSNEEQPKEDKAPADNNNDDSDSDSDSDDGEKPATAIRFGGISAAVKEKDQDNDASRFEDIFKVMATPEVEGALMSARRRKQANDDDSDSEGEQGAGGEAGPGGSHAKARSRRHQSSRHGSANSSNAGSTVGTASSRRKVEGLARNEQTPSRRRTTTRGRAGTVAPVDQPPPPPGLPPGVQSSIIAPLDTSSASMTMTDSGSLSDNALPSPRRRRHHHSARRRTELQTEIAECKKALSDPNTPDMAPWRARMTKAETELRELDHLPAADDTYAIAMVAAQAASAMASGKPLPESQQDIVAKAQLMIGERQAQAQQQLATAALVSPRRRRGNTTNSERPVAPLSVSAKSPADAIRELKIRKMVLAGQIGAMKKQLAALAAPDDKKRVETSLKSVEQELAKLDEDIKQLSTEAAPAAAAVPIQAKS